MNPMTAAPLTHRVFSLGEYVLATVDGQVYFARVIGHEDGRCLGKYVPAYPGWIYHVTLLGVSDQTPLGGIKLVREDRLEKGQ